MTCLHLTEAGDGGTGERADGLAAAELPSDAAHFTPALVRAFVRGCSAPGDLVLDPFAGTGTTVDVALAEGRRAVGVELDEERVDAVRARLGGRSDAAVVLADARDLRGALEGVLAGPLAGPVGLVVTSPPWMTLTDHPENPLTAYSTLDADYATYLEELAAVFADVRSLLAPDGRVVLHLANLVDDDGVHTTPVAFDVGSRLSRVLRLEREVALHWDVPMPMTTGEYALVFRR